MIYGKIGIKKYKNIHKGTKNLINTHILHTQPILHFFGIFKDFWGIIRLGCCLNWFVTLRRWSNDIRKNRNAKILKYSQGYEDFEESSHSSYPPNSLLLWILTIFVPSQISTSLDFSKFFGASYGLVVV